MKDLWEERKMTDNVMNRSSKRGIAIGSVVFLFPFFNN